MSDRQAPTWTTLRLLEWTRKYLQCADVLEPRLTAEILLAHALGVSRLDLYAHFDDVPTAPQRDAFRQLVRRAATHEPAAYIVGRKEFYSLSFTVSPDVLIPRPETELLVEHAIEHLRALGRPGRLWDACTGCGCVAVALAAHVRDAEVLATDISPAAVEIARRNVAAHGLGDRVRCAVADLLAAPRDDEAKPNAAEAPFDAITANPPYVAAGEEVAPCVKHEPDVALYAGASGLECIRRLVKQAPGRLAPGGALVMEFGFGQAEDVRDLLDASGAFEEPTVYRDRQDLERALVAIRL